MSHQSQPTILLLFQEAGALRDDPSYRGISAWWQNRFNRDFRVDWDDTESSQDDSSDQTEKYITVQEQTYLVTFNLKDGFAVFAGKAFSPRQNYEVYFVLNGELKESTDSLERARFIANSYANWHHPCVIIDTKSGQVVAIHRNDTMSPPSSVMI